MSLSNALRPGQRVVVSWAHQHLAAGTEGRLRVPVRCQGTSESQAGSSGDLLAAMHCTRGPQSDVDRVVEWEFN